MTEAASIKVWLIINIKKFFQTFLIKVKHLKMKKTSINLDKGNQKKSYLKEQRIKVYWLKKEQKYKILMRTLHVIVVMRKKKNKWSLMLLLRRHSLFPGIKYRKAKDYKRSLKISIVKKAIILMNRYLWKMSLIISIKISQA